jgi:RNA polymerase primary sigma factor
VRLQLPIMEALRNPNLEDYEIESPEFRTNRLRLLEDPDPSALNEPITEAQLPAVEFRKTHTDNSSLDPAQIYLREISQYQLLTAEQEIQLAQQLEEGKKAERDLVKLNLPQTERERLEQTAELGRQARNRLVEANLRLVISVAQKRNYVGKGVSFLDLIQEGNIGLQIGAEKYQWQKGFRFSTYVYWWIRQAMSRSLADQSRTIRVPVHMVEAINKLAKTQRELEVELGEEPSDKLLAETMGCDVERINAIRTAARQSISLDTPFGEDGDTTRGDLVPDNKAGENVVNKAEITDLSERLQNSLDQLHPRERKVLRLKFGLDRGYERTLGEVGEELGVSRERIRQIEASALGKLRRMPQVRIELMDYLQS